MEYWWLVGERLHGECLRAKNFYSLAEKNPSPLKKGIHWNENMPGKGK
jgi:hypothetical protein